MPRPPRSTGEPPVPPLSPIETARYSYDLLESLRKIALSQGQYLLARLIEIAAIEAKSLGAHGGPSDPPRRRGRPDDA